MEDSTRKLLFVLLDEAGINDRHDFASEVLGTPVSSYGLLDDHEAWEIIQRLKEMINAGHSGRGRRYTAAAAKGDPLCCGVRQRSPECAYCGAILRQ